MKKLKLWLVLAAAAAYLCACGPDSEPQSTSTPDPSHISTGTGGQIQDTIPDDSPGDITDDSKPPKEGMVRSRLTNEWVDADVASTRPIAVLIPNEIGAVPQYNLSEASVLYEANIENRMSRLMAVYEGWKNLGTIGNIRSARSYFIFWAYEWDAFLVHSGGPYFIDDMISDPDAQNINDHVGTDAAAFFRDSSRSTPHNLYATGTGILNVVNRKGYSLRYRGLTDNNHYRFTDKSHQNTLTQYGNDSKSAVYIDMSGCYPLTRCYFEYDENDGLYYRFQYLSGGGDGPHIDGMTGEQLAFKNILVQYVTYEKINDDGYLTFLCHDSTMDGWYFTNGRGIHITWEKSGDYGATRYYDDYGNEILMNTGKTMVCIVLSDDNFTFR